MEKSGLKKLLKSLKLNESTISMILGALVIIVVGALIFNYFRGVSRPPEEGVIPEEIEKLRLIEEEGKLVPEGLPTEYRVKAGDDLWKIAEAHYGSGYNWVDIARENQLVNPDVIYVDQELIIPRSAVIQPLATGITAFGPTIEQGQYTVEEGDHLWGIAVRAYGDGYQWTQLAQVNNISNPDIIDPGDVLTIPRK